MDKDDKSQECEAGFIEEYRWDSDIEDYVLVSRKPARKEL